MRWKKEPSPCLNFGDCLVGAWRVLGNCLEGVLRVSGGARVSMGCLNGNLVGQDRSG